MDGKIYHHCYKGVQSKVQWQVIDTVYGVLENSSSPRLTVPSTDTARTVDKQEDYLAWMDLAMRCKMKKKNLNKLAEKDIWIHPCGALGDAKLKIM